MGKTNELTEIVYVFKGTRRNLMRLPFEIFPPQVLEGTPEQRPRKTSTPSATVASRRSTELASRMEATMTKTFKSSLLDTCIAQARTWYARCTKLALAALECVAKNTAQLAAGCTK
eukprot:1445248-Amphidinium_carterae.1